jgi:ribose transport system ATP-binding protein
MTGNEVLVVKNLEKRFAATHANNNISLAFRRGSVHGLAGENGSGKSTLASILCGIQPADEGEIFKNGRPYAPQNPLDANRRGVAMVVQELGVIEALSPAVNMFLGRTGQFTRLGVLDMKKLKEAARAQLDKWDLGAVPLEGTMGDLSIEQRKIVELGRALSVDPDFLVLDEISQALSQDNRQRLYRFLQEFTAQGRTVLLITHDLEEMLRICDRVSVLRDGRLIDTQAREALTLEALKRLMIGREVEGDADWAGRETALEARVLLEVRGLTLPGTLRDISFDLHRGEILGVCGLSESGIHDLGQALFGVAEGKRSGTALAKARGVLLKTGRDVIRAGGAYLSKDRDACGLMLGAGIDTNLAVPNAKALSGAGGFLRPGGLRALAEKALKAFDIKAQGVDQVVGSLSGGNKQKVNLSRWLVRDLEFMILDCPTRGVDVGVKAYIYRMLSDAKKQGLAVLLITDELSEAIGLADRILVLREGTLAATLCRKDGFTEDKFIEVMLA